MHLCCFIALFPGHTPSPERVAWYPLFAHVNRELSVISVYNDVTFGYASINIFNVSCHESVKEDSRVPISTETNSTIFEYSIVTVPFECHSTHTNIRVLRNRPSRDIPRVSIDKYGE